MTFTNINLTEEFFNTAFEDCESSYIRVSSVNPIDENNFKSFAELDIKYNGHSDANLQSYYGVSIIKLSEDKYEEVVKICETTKLLTPNIQKFLIELKFKQNAGKVKKSPTRKNLNHYDFYKDDNFTMDKINVIEAREYKRGAA